MDSLTQLTLGAAVGEAVLGKKIGNKAIFWGAAAGTLADLDVIPGMFLDTPSRLLFHRGFSHSLVFVIGATLIFAPIFQRCFKSYKTTKSEWYRYFGLIFLASILIDAFTTYGTQLLWPHPYRFEFNTIFVVDPMFTLPLLVTLIWLMFISRESAFRKRLSSAGLIISGIYLLFTVVNKQVINATFRSALEDQNIAFSKMISTPTPLNQVLWSAVAETKDGFYTGYYSHFDKYKHIDFVFSPKNHHLLNHLMEYKNVQQIIRFTKGFYTVQQTEDGFIVNDLRFGQITNWETGGGDYVFRYNINTDQALPNVDQAERSFEGSGEAFAQLWQRMMGRRAF
jgi:inner membrane protein